MSKGDSMATNDGNAVAQGGNDLTDDELELVSGGGGKPHKAPCVGEDLRKCQMSGVRLPCVCPDYDRH
jgi:hypothetical protein